MPTSINIRLRDIAQAIKVHFVQPETTGLWWTATQLITSAPRWASGLSPSPSQMEVERALIADCTECVKCQGQRMFRFSGSRTATFVLSEEFCAKAAVCRAAKAMAPTSL